MTTFAPKPEHAPRPVECVGGPRDGEMVQLPAGQAWMLVTDHGREVGAKEAGWRAEYGLCEDGRLHFGGWRHRDGRAHAPARGARP